MGQLFLCTRGTVIRTGSSTTGAYRIDGLALRDGDYPIIIDGVDISESDMVMPVALLGGKKILYSFGEDFGDVTINGRVLLGPVDRGTASERLVSLIRWFRANRVSASKTPIKVSILHESKSVRVYVVGMKMGAPDPQYNIQPFTIIGLLVPLPT